MADTGIRERMEVKEGMEGLERSRPVAEKAVHKGEHDIWRPVLEELDRLAERGKNVMVAIDGRCGSGKTGLAGLIEGLFSCNVLHMDDFYLPLRLRPENWRQIPGGNMDFQRLREELLIPLRKGKTALYRPYSCAGDEVGEGAVLPFRTMTVVEGSYSQHPSMGVEYDLTVFLTCSREEQLKRLRLREGDGFGAFERQWIPMEERYFQIYEIENKSVLKIDTGSL